MHDDSDRPSSAQQKRRKIAKALMAQPSTTSVLAPGPDLTKKQAAYVDAIASGASIVKAARGAGYVNPEKAVHALEKNVNITLALEQERAKNALFLGFSRRDVLEGIADAIEQAKTMADPMAQIAGWREVAKICGYYAPEVKKVELTHSHKRKLDELELLSDQELLEMALRPALDAEFSLVSPQTPLSPPSEPQN